mmetsp:Transcript_13137/g.9519  ORF Transcript_13137/g.9519 Transcript_13137/m.9519 type:complete len:141 (+) Transcript_13137:479-901(+)
MPFFLLTFIMLNKHQYFARRVIMSSLFLTIYVSVFLKLPVEKGMNRQENQIVQLADSIPFFSHLAYFEIYEIIRILYMNVFNLVLALSRLIDIHPVDQKFTAIRKMGRQITYGLTICEVLNPQRPPKQENPPPIGEQPND